MFKCIRNDKEINVYQYTQSFMDELISFGPDEFEDTCFVVISGMTDTEFEWDYYKKELKIVYSNFSNTYENVTVENFRNPEVINLTDFIIKEDDKYHIESCYFFNNSMWEI